MTADCTDDPDCPEWDPEEKRHGTDYVEDDEEGYAFIVDCRGEPDDAWIRSDATINLEDAT